VRALLPFSNLPLWLLTSPLSRKNSYAVLTAADDISNEYTRGKQGESAIFYVARPDASRPSYREIYPKWINPDGSTGKTSFFLYNEGLGVTGRSDPLLRRPPQAPNLTRSGCCTGHR
jgi:hypothetical protein